MHAAVCRFDGKRVVVPWPSSDAFFWPPWITDKYLRAGVAGYFLVYPTPSSYVPHFTLHSPLLMHVPNDPLQRCRCQPPFRLNTRLVHPPSQSDPSL